eukprot:1401419-Lingulodinium_polyedra.AAC.1
MEILHPYTLHEAKCHVHNRTRVNIAPSAWRMFMLTVATGPTQCLGIVRTVEQELCWVYDGSAVDSSLAHQAL